MALIITANVIPQTFDPGSLSLLLSKPVSRWKLYIAQFLGGCAFVTLTTGFFFVGIWLFLGMRMGFWNARLLFYIPSFIGIFAIYYSASAIAGLLWRSPDRIGRCWRKFVVVHICYVSRQHRSARHRMIAFRFSSIDFAQGPE